ncbi:MAG TPA: helix-turn-helix domain-containing protein [Roseiflexaceae bacterium]|jgi:hypothetical protein
MAHGKKTDQQRIAATERRIQALAYRKAGISYRRIADELRSSPSTIVRDVREALTELGGLQDQSAEELRTLEAARLDDLQAALWPQARSGSVKAIGMVLRIMERRARLFGLDAQPGALMPGDIAIIVRWHDANRIIDVTPTDGDAAPTPPLAADDRAALGALSYRVRWETMGQVEAGRDAEPEDRAGEGR